MIKGAYYQLIILKMKLSFLLIKKSDNKKRKIPLQQN